MATRTRTGRTPSVTDWITPWITMTEIGVTAPWVIGYRTATFLMGGWPPSAKDTREYTRMWTEKAEAFTQAARVAMTTPPGPVATGRALTPVRDTVRGNVRRLSRN